jgi:L-lactate dehydrogenase complex protein LldG
MDESIIKEKVMNAIRHALINKDKIIAESKQDVDEDCFTPLSDEIEVDFVQNFISNGGKFVLCEDKYDLLLKLSETAEEQKWNSITCCSKAIKEILTAAELPFDENITDFSSINVGITFCECLIARYGSILVSSKLDKNDVKIASLSNKHVVIAQIDQVVPDIKTALMWVKQKYSNSLPNSMTMITGLSKTDNVEKKFIAGGQGPKSLLLFLVNGKII